MQVTTDGSSEAALLQQRRRQQGRRGWAPQSTARLRPQLAVLGATITSLAALCKQLQNAHLVLLRELARHVIETANCLGLHGNIVVPQDEDPEQWSCWFEALYVLTRDVKHGVARLVSRQSSHSSLHNRITTILDSLQSNLLLTGGNLH